MAQPDAIANILSAESCSIVLEISPPDYVAKISRYLESSEGQNQHKVSNEPAADRSDSGDSLFLTQKPVPEAVRSGRRRLYKLRSDLASPRDLEESCDTPSSDSHGEAKSDNERTKKNIRLPKYSFPFLSERKWKPRSTVLTGQRNKCLHNFVMAGFFKCAKELQQGNRRENYVEFPLPVAGMDGDCISPLSEGEEERSGDEDIKVVERKCFVARSKTKSRQTWCNQMTRQREAENSRQETSQETQHKKLKKIAAKTSTSKITPLYLDPESSADRESSSLSMVVRETSDEHVTRDGNYLTQNVTQKGEHLTQGNKKTLFQQTAGELELCKESDTTVCEPPDVHRSLSQYTLKDRASTTAADPPADALHTDDQSQTGQTEDEPESQSLLHSLQGLISDINNDSVCSETRVKDRKKKKKHRVCGSTEHEMGERQEEPEGLQAAKSVNVELEEHPCLSDDNRPPVSQTSDELEVNERNCTQNSSHDNRTVRQKERDIPNSEQKKNRKESAAGNIRQEVDGSGVRMEDSVFSLNHDIENSGTKKKRKRSEKDVEQSQSRAGDEPLNDDAGREQGKKKKKKKDKTIEVAEKCEKKESRNRTLDLLPTSAGQLEESGNGLDNTLSCEGTLESSYVKKKKHKKKRHSSSNDATPDEEEVAGMSFSNDAATVEERTGKSLKKKKKRKKNISDGVDVSYTPEENEEFEDKTQKTKEGHEDQNPELVTKKKKRGEISSKITFEDSVVQSDYSVAVQEWEEKRTSSFLVADAEEKVARRRNSPSQSVNAHVWGTEKPSVSSGDFETESAEITGHGEEFNDGVRKKNKKRKRKMSMTQESVEKDHKDDFEEPNKTRALPETIDMGLKRKKKCVGNESDSVISVKSLESTADSGHSPTVEDVVLKKKMKTKKWKDKPCLVIEENPVAASEDTESEECALNAGSVVSHRKEGECLTLPLVSKGKHVRSTDISYTSSTFDQVTKETLNVFEQASSSSETLGNQTLKDKRDKKKTKALDNLLQGKLLIKSTQSSENKKKKTRNKLSHVPNSLTSNNALSEIAFSKSEIPSSDYVMNNKHKKVKHKHYNPSEDLLGR